MLCGPSYCSLSLDCYWPILAWDYSLGWLCEAQPQIQCASCCAGADHTNWSLPQQGLVPVEITLWVCCLCSLLYSAVFVWSWPLGVLSVGFFRGTVLQAYVIPCLWLDLFQALSDLQCVAPSAGPGCLWKGPGCSPRPAFTNTRPGDVSAKVSMHPEICLFL